MKNLLRFALTTALLAVFAAWAIGFLWGVGRVLLLLFMIMVMGVQ